MITITQLFTKAKHWEHPIKKRKLYGKISKDYLPVGLPVISDKKINCCLITYTLCLAVSKERHYVLFFNTWMYCISNQMSSTYIPLWSITVIRQCVLLIIWLCQPVDCGHACFTRSITNIKIIGLTILTPQSALGWKQCSAGCRTSPSRLRHHDKVWLYRDPPVQ